MIDCIYLLSTYYTRAHLVHGAARDALLAEARITIVQSRLPAEERRALLVEHDRIVREVRP